MTFHAKVIKGGKIVIPAQLRRAMGVKEGDVLVIEEEDGKMVVQTYRQVVRRIQDKWKARVPEDVSMTDELIAERRREFEKEEAEARGGGETRHPAP